MSTKDLFSGQSSVYAAFRPTYPDDLYQFIFKHLQNKNTAWDCGTGNGQVALYLAKHFGKVYATDISEKQLANAPKTSNVFYSVCKAEQTNFENQQFDLITVGQALHWFDRDLFYHEVKRTGKPGGLIAVWGYGNLTISASIDNKFLDFYNGVVGPYWDDARRHVENEYKSIEFPFTKIKTPGFKIIVEWPLAQFAGYLTSWSATQTFIRERGFDPVPEFIRSLSSYWHADEVKTVTFPVFLKLGRIV